MLARCAEHSHNMTSLETYAYQDGRCDQRVTCDCDAGYKENGHQCVGKLKILLKVLSLQFLPPCYGGALRTECTGILFWPLCSSIIEFARNSHKFSTFQESFWNYFFYWPVTSPSLSPDVIIPYKSCLCAFWHCHPYFILQFFFIFAYL